MSATATIDTVTLNIIHNALTNIASEMALVMLKTSYSTIFNEGLDFTTVLLDKHGDLIAEKNYTPSMMGAIPHTVKWAVDEKGIEHFRPGDVLVHNDCYRGGCHLPEHMMMRPVFVGDRLFGFAGNIGHVAEIGGKAPGSFAADATDVYQEGLRLPPVKLIDRGEYVEDVWRIILSNHRTPHNTWGDFHAMIGSLETAERRIRELAERYPVDLIERATADLMDYSERRLRAEIAELPDGEYSATMLVEDDGVTPDPFRVSVTIVIRGDEIIADFTGSDPQVRGPMNCTVVVVASAIYNAVFSMVDPHTTIPRNSGCYRPIKFIAPAGSVVNVVHPGPCVGGNTDLQPKLIDLLFKAFSQAVPDRAAAASGGSSSNFLFGGIHPETGVYYTNYHFDGHGTGGTARKDGNNGEITRHSNCRNTPIEVFEGRYPFRTLEYRLMPDSGGPGEHRGGLATTRTLEVTADEITLSCLFDRAKIPGWGLFDGKDGGLSKLLVKRKGDDTFRTFVEAYRTVSPTKFTNVLLKRGDIVRYQTPGGGGYGDPLRRDPQSVLTDVRNGWVSIDAARAEYGVDIADTGDDYQLDEAATTALRSANHG
ncbi:MAG: N-methylhydantoinase [Thermomicrobiales bacterium]|jgi:N-methylhydantoinase B/oxoprolinase/acetone carboxylase alpha subunit|nr:N-methylhydantoinase [Thermomicrobiales bacterium]MEA2525309.1 N-methylhydantoinase [Thermomicrobiales bacterium]